jgi:hypothetical protein
MQNTTSVAQPVLKNVQNKFRNKVFCLCWDGLSENVFTVCIPSCGPLIWVNQLNCLAKLFAFV